MGLPADLPPDGTAMRPAWAYIVDDREDAGPVRPARPARRRRQQRYDKPAPGVIQIRVTGATDGDIQAFVAHLTEVGLRLWQTKDRLYRHEDGAVCRYYTTDVHEART